MQQEIISTLTYFSYFSYAPTLKEIYMFLKMRTTKKDLMRVLKGMTKQKKITEETNTACDSRFFLNISGKHTVGEYSMETLKIKNKISKTKIQKGQNYIKILSLFPQIKLIGLSGSVAMMNADSDDDIDLFIISAHHRIWTARLLALILSSLMGVRRKYGQHMARDKVCLNLFFDEYCLELPQRKQTEYGGHELLQMKPIHVKDDIYSRLLDSNRWVYDIFPNAKLEIKDKRLTIKNNHNTYIGILVEKLCKILQLFFINRHKTSELISDDQLWFHPYDHGNRVRQLIKIR